MPVKVLMSLFDEWKLSAFRLYVRLKWFIVQLLTVIVLISILLWTSVFMYASFYYIYMPAVVHERPVHFSFRADCENNERLCTFPLANLSLLANNRELLVFGQPYVVKLHMEMPESFANQRLGMFMIQLQFYTRFGDVVFTTARSAVLHYKSWLYRTLETLFFFLPSLFIGTTVLKQTLTVELCESYLSDPYRPTLGALIEVQSKKVDIYNASLIMHAKFSGLRYILFNWPLLSAVFGIASNFFFLSLTALFSWFAYVIRSKDELHSLTSSTDSAEHLLNSKDTDDYSKHVQDLPDSSDMTMPPADEACGTGDCHLIRNDQDADDRSVTFLGMDSVRHRTIKQE